MGRIVIDQWAQNLEGALRGLMKIGPWIPDESRGDLRCIWCDVEAGEDHEWNCAYFEAEDVLARLDRIRS